MSLVPIPKVPNAYYECACSRLYYIDMIYERNVLANWRLSASDMTAKNLLFLTNEGSYSVATYEETGIDANNLDLNSLIGASANYFNRFILDNSNPLISIGYCFNNHDILFMNTNRADFFVYYSS